MANIEKLKSTSVLKEWREKINELIDFSGTLAVIDHSSELDTYGVGNNTKYGHLRLSDSLQNDYDVSSGFAATPKAVKSLYDTTLKVGDVLTKDNITSIDGALINNSSIVRVAKITADEIDAPIRKTEYAVRDQWGNIIDSTYMTRLELEDFVSALDTTIFRDGLNLKLNSILEEVPSYSFLYQSSFNGYMPSINLKTLDGRTGFGTQSDRLSLTYFTFNNTTETPNASLDLLSTGVRVDGLLSSTKGLSVTGNSTLTNATISNTLNVTGSTNVNTAYVSNNVCFNSASNSVVLRNTKNSFEILTSTSPNGTALSSLIPLSFVIKNASDTLTGKMTIGGDLHTNGKVTATGKVHNAIWNDYAEFFEKGEETEVGDFIALDLSSDEEVYVKASKENPSVVGVHSDSYGPIIGGTEDFEESEKSFIPVGLAGRVKAKIAGRIKKGDFVVLSDEPGVGCVYDAERNIPLDVVGICLEASDDEGTKLLKIKIK